MKIVKIFLFKKKFPIILNQKIDCQDKLVSVSDTVSKSKKILEKFHIYELRKKFTPTKNTYLNNIHSFQICFFASIWAPS
jgi:hypothetical protein